ncbi:MAG: GNAT family N-acetyltransferase [Chlorobiaceae bacterium]|nr:GNAT family N-acetyltransferase [Chlorobiaceae bacterium]NTW73714.1 GNAT family N-acetyltransferase [Chlorobiaceae bacterium]
MSKSWKFQIYRSWDEVDGKAFLDQWSRWIEAAPEGHAFYHPSILKAWTDTYRTLQDIQPWYVVACSGDLTFFLPLILWKRNWKNAFLRMIVPAGFSDFDYHDPIITGLATREEICAFWDAVEKYVFIDNNNSYDEVSLPGMHIPGKSSQWDADVDACPYIDLSLFKDHQAYFSQLKGGLRQDLGRRERRMSEKGLIEFKRYGADELDQALAALPSFLDAHRKRWPKAYKAPGLHENILKSALATDVVHFSELRFNGLAISWHLGFAFKSRFYHYIPALSEDEAYKNYSPGKIHLSYLIKDSFAQGLRIFDFLRGAHDYKGSWTDKEIQLYRYARESGRIDSRLRQQAFLAMEKLKS